MADGSAGRPREVSGRDVLKVFHDRDDIAEPLTADDVLERGELDCSRRTVINRLEELDGEEVRGKDVGRGSSVWWIPVRE